METALDMNTILGLPQNEAQSRLLSRGFAVEVELLEPRKPPKGDELRVIQVLRTGDRAVKLIVANFRTRVAEADI